MSVSYPLFAFGKDDSSIRLIENERDILGKLEAIDIENGEYQIWDAGGAGAEIQVSVGAFKSKLISVTSRAPSIPIRDAFSLYANATGLSKPQLEGTPMEVWNRFQEELKRGKPLNS